MSQSMIRKLIWLFSRSKPQLFLLDLQQYWNFFNPNKFSDTPSQDGVRNREQIVSLYAGRETEDMAWVTTDQIVATLGHPDVCQAGVSTGSNQENVERTLPLLIVISFFICNGVYVVYETEYLLTATGS